MADEVAWEVELEVKRGQFNNFQALTMDMVEAARAEPGALIYERFVLDDGKTVWVYERYVDSAAAIAHLKTFADRLGGRFGSMVTRKRFTVFGDPSDELKAILDGFGAKYLARLAGFSRS